MLKVSNPGIIFQLIGNKLGKPIVDRGVQSPLHIFIVFYITGIQTELESGQLIQNLDFEAHRK